MTSGASEILQFILYETISVDCLLFVTLNALELGVRSGQRKSRLLVIEFCRLPIIGRVALLTVCYLPIVRLNRELSEMHIAMACLAIWAEGAEDRHFGPF